jgi:hypothetical protein
MARTTLTTRVEVLEHQLPESVARLDAAISDLRSEMRQEFAAVRRELREGDEETRRYMRVLHEDLVDRIKMLGEAIDERRRD